MTDENNPKPTKKTSAVPLRKETVRVTLKSTPDDKAAGDGNGKAEPPAPAPTIPLQTGDGGAPAVPAPAPTVKLQTAAPTQAPEPAPTLKLQTGPETGPPTKAPEPAPTVKLDTPATAAPTGATSQPLPKATVQLGQSQPMPAPGGSATQAPTIIAGETPEAPKAEGPAAALSIIAMVAALIVLGVQIGTANIWVNDETQENPGWGKLFE